MNRFRCFFKTLVYFLLFHQNRAYRNLVARKVTTATQSSTYKSFSADRTIDGYPDRLRIVDGSCSHTDFNQTNAWLRINLDKVYNVKEVRFWYRNDRSSDLLNTIRLHYYSLFFYNSSGYGIKCYEDRTNFQTPIPTPSTVECKSKTSRIQFLTFQPSPYDGKQVFLEICEVQIYGCDVNQYGENCTECNAKCTECHITKGCVSCQGKFTGSTCELCPPGYMESNCDTPCTTGWYGHNCSMECSGHCFGDDTCFHVNGGCVKGCAPGYRGPTCSEECPSGTYGSQCNGTCEDSCKDKMCHSATGMCTLGCIDGKIGDTCRQVCPEGYFGRRCLEECGRCVNDTCDHVNGSCSGPCQDGWAGERCLLAKDDLESPVESSYSFLVEAVAGTGALVAVIAVAATLILWLQHKKAHRTRKNSEHSDEKDLGRGLSLHPKTCGIYENQHRFSTATERQNNPTGELPNSTDRPWYEVINKNEISADEYDTLEF